MAARKTVLGGLSIALVALVVIWLYQPPAKQATIPQKQIEQPELPHATDLQWRVGYRQSYRVESSSSMQLNMDDSAAPQSLTVELRADLEMQILSSNQDTALVGMQLSSVDLKISGSSDAATNRALSEPFRVRFNTNGYPKAFEFAAEISEKDRSILENLVRMFQVTNDSGDTWSARESNGSGSYEAVYQRVGARQLQKSKRHFQARSFAEMFDGAKIESSESIRLDSANDWIKAMTVDEKLTSRGQKGPAMTIRNLARLELRESSTTAASGDKWNFVATPEPAQTQISQPSKPNLSSEQARARILSAVPELDEASQGRTRWIHELRDLLRVDDSLPAVILEILKNGELSDRTRADLYLALGLADTGSAQQALITVFQQPDWQIEDALRAIVALGGVNTPSTVSVSALWETLFEVSSGGERQRLASTTTFALGRLGRTLIAQDDPQYMNLRAGLLDGALSWADDKQRANFVHAIGNTGDPSLTNEIVGLLNDDHATVRRATAQSLGMLDIDRVANDLVSHFNRETDSQVRGAIAESLSNWSNPTREANSIITTTLQNEKDINTRYNLARFLGENLQTYPENRQVLEQLLRHEKNNRIRQMVANTLAAGG